MEIRYTLWNPNGNITALVETLCEPADYSKIACKIMCKEPLCEQVGFISGRALQMAGGEFCGNASMCAASYFYTADGVEPGAEKEYAFAVSGSDTPVCACVKNDCGRFNVTLEMPKHKRIFYKDFPIDNTVLNLPVVEFEGIMHIIAENLSASDKTLEACIKDWCLSLNADAVGIMLLDRSKNTLRPLVYVKNISSLFWEGSCASGTAAAGVYIAETNNKATEICFTEPAASLTVISCKNMPPKLKGTAQVIKSDAISF